MASIGRIVASGNTIGDIDGFEKLPLQEVIGDIPTLIVGKGNAITLYGKDKVKVLNRKIEENVYWTYSKFEKRTEFESDTRKFCKKATDKLIKGLRYYYFNPFTESLTNAKRLINVLSNDEPKCAYIVKKHIYISYKDIVYGLNTECFEYIGVKEKKIIDFIERNGIEIITDSDFLSKDTKKIIGDNKICIPYLYTVLKTA